MTGTRFAMPDWHAILACQSDRWPTVHLVLLTPVHHNCHLGRVPETKCPARRNPLQRNDLRRLPRWQPIIQCREDGTAHQTPVQRLTLRTLYVSTYSILSMRPPVAAGPPKCTKFHCPLSGLGSVVDRPTDENRSTCSRRDFD